MYWSLYFLNYNLFTSTSVSIYVHMLVKIKNFWLAKILKCNVNNLCSYKKELNSLFNYYTLNITKSGLKT